MGDDLDLGSLEASATSDVPNSVEDVSPSGDSSNPDSSGYGVDIGGSGSGDSGSSSDSSLPADMTQSSIDPSKGWFGNHVSDLSKDSPIMQPSLEDKVAGYVDKVLGTKGGASDNTQNAPGSRVTPNGTTESMWSSPKSANTSFDKFMSGVKTAADTAGKVLQTFRNGGHPDGQNTGGGQSAQASSQYGVQPPTGGMYGGNPLATPIYSGGSQTPGYTPYNPSASQQPFTPMYPTR